MRFLLLALCVAAALLWRHGARAQSSLLAVRFGPAALKARETHGAVLVLAHGDGARRVYVFLPQSPALSGPVPVVFFHHGWQGMDPLNYGALIDHLVREGNVVIYPVYQQSAATSPQGIVETASLADRQGVQIMEAENLTPDRRKILYLGYSMGAAISLDLALGPNRFGLPAPDALLLLAPGDAPAVATGPAGRSIIGPVELLPKTLPIAIMTGAEDTQIGLPTARALMARVCHAAPGRRVLMVLPGDSHNGVTVHARHGAPGAPDPRYDFPLTDENFPVTLPGQPAYAASPSLNQLDFYGFWKVADSLLDGFASFQPPGIVFGNGTPAQLYLGAWPDGTPFMPMHLENPCG